jgi:N-acetylmuramoyl-L-alanine amidase
MREITHIFVHTAAAATKAKKATATTPAVPSKPIDVSAASMRAYHKSQGWNDIGYHEVIRMTGKVERGRPLEQPGAHVEGFNAKTIGIVLSGHGDLEPPTAAQYETLKKRIIFYLKKFGLVETFLKNPKRVLGHREINDLIKAGVTKAPRTTKTCPGTKFDMPKLRLDLIADLTQG